MVLDTRHPQPRWVGGKTAPYCLRNTGGIGGPQPRFESYSSDLDRSRTLDPLGARLSWIPGWMSLRGGGGASLSLVSPTSSPGTRLLPPLQGARGLRRLLRFYFCTFRFLARGWSAAAAESSGIRRPDGCGTGCGAPVSFSEAAPGLDIVGDRVRGKGRGDRKTERQIQRD